VDGRILDANTGDVLDSVSVTKALRACIETSVLTLIKRLDLDSGA
jgi:hypothetical protein